MGLKANGVYSSAIDNATRRGSEMPISEMPISEIISQIEALEDNPSNYVGGLQGLMNGNGLKAAAQKKIASLEKKLDALADESDEG